MKERIEQTRSSRFLYAVLMASIALAAGVGISALEGAPAPLSWLQVFLGIVSWVTSFTAFAYLIGALIGPRWEIDLSGDGTGD